MLIPWTGFQEICDLPASGRFRIFDQQDDGRHRLKCRSELTGVVKGMSEEWQASAAAWIASMGAAGDWGRRHVLDPVMLGRVTGRGFARALDVGCGEGRFCRMLAAAGVSCVGIDPASAMIEEARRRDPRGDYRIGNAEALAFEEASFDLVVSYLSLIDIPDFRAAIREMRRVLKPGGTLLIANLTSFNTAAVGNGRVADADGKRRHFAIDRYLDEFPTWVEWSGIRVRNWHRPLGAYMTALLDQGLRLAFFAEPEASSGDAADRAAFRRLPFFLVMEWQAPPA